MREIVSHDYGIRFAQIVIDWTPLDIHYLPRKKCCSNVGHSLMITWYWQGPTRTHDATRPDASTLLKVSQKVFASVCVLYSMISISRYRRPVRHGSIVHYANLPVKPFLKIFWNYFFLDLLVSARLRSASRFLSARYSVLGHTPALCAASYLDTPWSTNSIALRTSWLCLAGMWVYLLFWRA